MYADHLYVVFPLSGVFLRVGKYGFRDLGS